MYEEFVQHAEQRGRDNTGEREGGRGGRKKEIERERERERE